VFFPLIEDGGGNPKGITELNVQMQISRGIVRPQFPGIQLLTSKLQIFADGDKRLPQISGFNWLVKRQSSGIYKQDVHTVESLGTVVL
jgi:hypothetical protein